MTQDGIPQDQPRNQVRDVALQQQLLVRRDRLQAAVPYLTNPGNVERLLHDIDDALDRMDAGTFGICETCHDTVENDRLLADPLCRNCLEHLSAAEQRVLERDLDLAFQIQSGLLPRPGVAARGWTTAYHYQPVGPVSGDFCDLIVLEDGTGFFFLGDVTGKGVAASLLMAHLNAIFRSLTVTTRKVDELVTKANRIFCEAIPSSHFATLVCGWLGANGQVDICNAGHCHPLHLHDGSVSRVETTGLPLGLACEGEYTSHKRTLAPGDSLVIYSDGLSETFNDAEEAYGVERPSELLRQRRGLAPKELLAALLEDLSSFRSGAPRTDDLTIMVIRRE